MKDLSEGDIDQFSKRTSVLGHSRNVSVKDVSMKVNYVYRIKNVAGRYELSSVLKSRRVLEVKSIMVNG